MIKYSHYLSSDKLAIFLFHGVVENSDRPVRNYTRKHLEKDYFYKLLKELRQKGTPLSIEDIIEHHRLAKPYPANSFAVSFDDGFENNYSVAAPILSDLRIPAVFYVSTYFIDSNSMSWTDRIEFCLEHTKKGKISFPWNEQAYFFNDPAAKIKIMDKLRARVKTDRNINLDDLVKNVFEQCAMPPIEQSTDSLDLKMNWQQVRDLHNQDLFTVGGHSHHHLNLGFLSPPELAYEISTSLRLLKERSNITATQYSYPEGLEYCYSENVIKNLQEHGVACSPTAIDGLNDIKTDLFHLRRIMVI
ncbi:MAG: polysaccharide deacetylase family protein [Smithellaceae bacterium]